MTVEVYREHFLPLVARIRMHFTFFYRFFQSYPPPSCTRWTVSWATNPTVKRTTAPSVEPDGTGCSVPTFAWSSVRFSFYWMSTGRMRRASTHKPWRARLLEHEGQETREKKYTKHTKRDTFTDMQDRERCIEDTCSRSHSDGHFKTRSLG